MTWYPEVIVDPVACRSRSVGAELLAVKIDVRAVSAHPRHTLHLVERKC